jgi:predicted deacetylase
MRLPMKKLTSNYTGMLIRLDDVAENMNWELMDKCEQLFDKYNIKPLMGVVPNNKDKELLLYKKKDKFWEKVRSWQNKGWEISMHGFSHVYDNQTNKKDYFNYGGKSEFFGHDFNKQKSKIDDGLKKFKEEKIKIRSFFAPNHTYDLNTFQALKESGIKNIIDGYGLIPYTENGLNFIPQLFYKEMMLPFGIQSTQIHLNYWEEKDYLIFENFVEKNKQKIITFEQAIDKIKNNFLCKVLNFLIKIILKFLRFFRKG